MLHTLFTLALVSSPAFPDPHRDEALLELGREHCQLFYDGELDTLWERMNSSLKSVFGDDVAGLESFHTQVWTDLGEETEVVRESAGEQGLLRSYTRVARYANYSGTIDFVWAFSGDDTIEVMGIAPSRTEAPSQHLDYRTKTELRLPFVDAWDVFWGGRTLSENYHTAYPDQRFAYDFLIFQDGKTHLGEGKRNEDYHCFGKRLVAPGGGTVVSMANDVKENVPGEMNPERALGNHVIIDHGNGEFSFMAHFKYGTVTVAAGEMVEPGQFLGLAGNSGNSSEPHLHYHLQTTPTFNMGEGLPSQFLRYLSNGELVERGEPAKGDRIQPE